MILDVNFKEVDHEIDADFGVLSVVNEGEVNPMDAVLYTKQNLTDEQKAQARENIGAAKQGEYGTVGSSDAVLYTAQTLTESQKTQARENIGVASKTVVDELAEAIQAIQEELSYEEIAITKFTNTASGTYELGRTIDSLTISWELNKAPTSQTLKGESLGVNVRSKTYSSVSTAQTYTLTVTDERGATATKDTSVSFVNGVYYGALDYGASIDSAVILGLTRKLQSGRSVSFSAGGGKRPTYALPTRYGTPTFKIGGFDYEWEKVKTFDFTNASGYTESYDVWMHSQNVTDSVTVNVT